MEIRYKGNGKINNDSLKISIQYYISLTLYPIPYTFIPYTSLTMIKESLNTI